MDPKNKKLKQNNKDINIYITDENDPDASLKLFFELFSSKSNTDRDYWLLDVTQLRFHGKSFANELKDLPNCNLDCELYLFDNDGDMIKIWEYYSINPNVPSQILPYTSWSQNEGLFNLNPRKWKRRNNLQLSLIHI